MKGEGVTPESGKIKKFRKKPVVIEALQYLPENVPYLKAWLGDAGVWASWLFHIKTLEGLMDVHPGAWVIKGVRGEFYACDEGIFAETYEEVQGSWPRAYVRRQEDCNLYRCPILTPAGQCHLRQGHPGPCDPHGDSHLEAS